MKLLYKINKTDPEGERSEVLRSNLVLCSPGGTTGEGFIITSCVAEGYILCYQFT